MLPLRASQMRRRFGQADKPLHLDRVVEVAGEIPAGWLSRMGKKSARAGDVLFGAQRIDFIFDSVVLTWNSDDARAMHGTGRGAQRGEGEPQVIPGKIEDVGERHDAQSSNKGATQQIRCWRTSGLIGIRHGVSLQAKGKKWDTDDGDCLMDQGALEGANHAETRTWRESAQSAEVTYVARVGVRLSVVRGRLGC
jgi:hypothetical protein